MGFAASTAPMAGQIAHQAGVAPARRMMPASREIDLSRLPASLKRTKCAGKEKQARG
jgi:hypothetical protein